MSSPKITVAVANAMLDAGIGTVANSGKLRVYDGIKPASCAIAVTTQVKLMEFTMAADAFPAANGGVLTANGMVATTALVGGTATWYRLFQSNGSTVLIDGDVGEQGSPEVVDLAIDNVTVTFDDVVAVTSYTITQSLG